MSVRKNHMRLSFDGRSENESFSRVAISAFMAQLSPTLEELNDVKTAVSEAVTNAVVHAYKHYGGEITLDASIWDDGRITLDVIDTGCGIDDIEQAMTPFFTSQPEMERAGMGFAVMQTFMDDIKVESAKARGTTVHMTKWVQGAKIH